VRAGRRLLIGALWPTAVVVAVQALGAAPAWAHSPAYNAAAALQSRHVAVDAAMLSTVPAARAKALEATIGSRAVFVAVLPGGSGQFELVEIESILGSPGVYLLLEDGRIQANVLGEHGITARQASDAALAAMAAHPGDAAAALTEAVDREVAGVQRYGSPREPSTSVPTNGGQGWPLPLEVLLAGTLVIVVGAGVAMRRTRRAGAVEPVATTLAASGRGSGSS
jgi:hypothetical protein